MESIKEIVQERYGAAARRVTEGGGKAGCCGAGACCGTVDPITSNLYGDEARALPAEALEASLGGGNPTALRVTMGLSRGWGDTYGAFTVGQYLDITGLADGRYRVRVTADGDSTDGSDRFLESDKTNNSTWADPQIMGDTVTVLE